MYWHFPGRWIHEWRIQVENSQRLFFKGNFREYTLSPLFSNRSTVYTSYVGEFCVRAPKTLERPKQVLCYPNKFKLMKSMGILSMTQLDKNAVSNIHANIPTELASSAKFKKYYPVCSTPKRPSHVYQKGELKRSQLIG